MKARFLWAFLPIFRGSLRGKRWLLATRSNFFLGSYEPEQTALFEQHVAPGAVVYDIGAHFGYYSLLSAVLAGEHGMAVAFEPSPTNLPVLRRHIELNHCGNIQVRELAVSDHDGSAHFDLGGGSGIGHLAKDGKVEVKMTRLDSLQEQLPPPNVIKIDVEGAELDVLHGGAATITGARPVIFLSLHSQELKQSCTQWLLQNGYTLQEILPMEIMALPERPR